MLLPTLYRFTPARWDRAVHTVRDGLRWCVSTVWTFVGVWNTTPFVYPFTHSPGGRSGDSTTEAPHGRSDMVTGGPLPW